MALSPPSIPPLVGRDRELAILREHLDAALAGQGGLVLIGGEAGVGKTALAEALSREATAHGELVLTGRCFDLAETPAYGPWLYLFERYPASADAPPPPAFAVPGTIGEVLSQSALFRQVLDFLKHLTARQPTILLLDDLHWADQASLDLVRFLAQSVATLPLLLLVTYRSEELTRRHPLYQLLPALVRESDATRLDLRPLDDAATRTLIAVRYHLADTDTDRLTTYLQARAEGNAFFLGELLRALEETDMLRLDGENWTVGDLRHTGVPQLLRQVIDSRLSRLDEQSQWLLVVAAVIGHEVPITVWATVAEVGGEILISTVEHALDARLLAELPGGERLQFAHALVREALYEGIPAVRRRRVHLRAGEALMVLTNPDPDAVAYHFQQASDPRAAAWLIKAGERALAVFAERLAAERLEVALALLDAHEADEQERGWVLASAAWANRFIDPPRAMHYAAGALRVAEQTGNRLLVLRVLHHRVWLLNDTGRMAAGLDDLLAARALIDTLTDAERADARNRAHFLDSGTLHDGTVTEYLAICGEFTRARELGEHLAADWAAAEPGAAGLSRETALAMGNCYFGLLYTYMYQGEPEKAARAAARSRLLYEDLGWDFMVGNVARVELLNALAYTPERQQEWRRLAGDTPGLGRVILLAADGQWSEARTVAAAIPSNLPLPTRQAARLLVAALDRACGETRSAWEVVRAVLPGGPTAELVKQHHVQVAALQLGAELALDEGDPTAATPWLAAYDALLARSAAVLGRSENQALWARYHRASGDAERAHEHAEHALAHARNPRQPLALLAAHRLLGELDTDTGRYDEAEKHLNASLALAEACQAPYERALNLLALAALRVATAETETARTLLDEAHGICERLGANPALARVGALIARLDAAKEIAPAYPAGLSAREVEVLRLVAHGHTNRDIADALFLSPHTVRHHLTHILAKTDAANRAEAAAFALRTGLA